MFIDVLHGWCDEILHQKDAWTLEKTILNHCYPLHFLGYQFMSNPTASILQLATPIFDHFCRGSTWDQPPRKIAGEPTSKWGSDDLPLLGPIHALVDVAEKVHLKGLKKREALKTKPWNTYRPKWIRYTSFEVGLPGCCFFCWGVGWKKCERLFVYDKK